MIRYRLSALIAVLAALLLPLTSCSGKISGVTMSLMPQPSGAAGLTGIINPDSEVRGVWVATVFNIDYPSSTDLDPDSLASELDAILDLCESRRLNTVYFQVRPSCDALYESELFPVSTFLSSTGSLTFDPLDYLVTQAHKRNIFVSAWVNPLRVTTSEWMTEHLPESHPASSHPDWVVNYGGKLYFDPGLPETREFVADGVREIVRKYDVDGVVYDDYFYPYPESDSSGTAITFDDSDTYLRYGGGLSLDDWRRENVNSLIRETYRAVKETDSECSFGVSPGGVWRNNDGSNGGSDTRGFETYESIYCDSVSWIREGIIDYISPQIYWTFDTSGTPFDTVAQWWNSVLDGTGVDLIVSHGAYRYEEGDWSSPSGQMKEQVEYSRKLLSYRGSMFYGLDEIRTNASDIGGELSDVFSENIIYTDPEPNGGGLAFISHKDGELVAVGQAVISGLSDPSLPIEFEKPLSREKSGEFHAAVSVSEGENRYVFRLGDKEFSLTLYGE